MSIRSFIAFSFGTLAQIWSCSVVADIYSEFPSEIDPDNRYVIYSHGLIVEGTNERRKHERWGVYDFPAIKSALVEDGSFELIAHHRPENTNIAEYVIRIKSWVTRLIEAGVSPENITLVGFSRGGHITALVSSRLRPLPINTALLATCWDNGVQDQRSIAFSGRFLSVYETSDMALSCSELAARSDDLISFEEVSITTGKEHGAFFKPLPEWIEPLLQWIRRDSAQ